jgi:hypothetical protein
MSIGLAHTPIQGPGNLRLGSLKFVNISKPEGTPCMRRVDFLCSRCCSGKFVNFVNFFTASGVLGLGAEGEPHHFQKTFYEKKNLPKKLYKVYKLTIPGARTRPRDMPHTRGMFSESKRLQSLELFSELPALLSPKEVTTPFVGSISMWADIGVDLI